MTPLRLINFAHHFHTKMPFQQGAHETYSDFDLRNNFHGYFSLSWVWNYPSFAMMSSHLGITPGIKVSSCVILLYFRNVEDFVTVLHSQSQFVFKVIVSNLENFPTLKREIMIAENKELYGSSGISALLFSPLIYCFYSVAGVALQLEAAQYSKSAWIKNYKYCRSCSFLNSSTSINT